MRILTRFVPGYLAIGLLAFSNPGLAQTYLGEVCWEVGAAGEPEPTGVFVKLAVQDVGDGHFLMNGRAVLPPEEDESNAELLSGNAEIVGEEVVIRLTGGSSSPDGVGSVQYHVRLSLTTFSGTFEGISRYYIRDTESFQDDYSEGQLTLAVCPS